MVRPSMSQWLTQNIDRRSTFGLRLTTLLVLGLTIAGCSTVRLAYERLDWIARWHAGHYVSFTRAQWAVFNDSFAEFWRWHREEELPVWIAELRGLAARTETLDRIDRQQLAQMSERYGRTLRRVTARLAPLACALGPGLSDAQTEELLAAVDEDVDDFRSEHVERSPEQARQDTLAAIEKPLRRWLGHLDDEQRRLIREWNDARPSVARDWLDYRRRWRSELATTLAQRREASFCPRIERLIARGSELWTDTQQRAFAADRARWLDLFAALLPTIDDDQRQHARRKLLALARDFDAVTRQRTTAATPATNGPGA